MDKARACATSSAEVRSFSESVSEGATKTITLLRAIEQTVTHLSWVQNRAKADTAFAAKAAELLRTCERHIAIDTDGVICASLEEAETRVQRLYGMLIEKRNAARNAAELQEDDRETIIEEYAHAIAAVADLHCSLTDLKWAIGEHDADLEKPTGDSFSDPKALRAYLKAV